MHSGGLELTKLTHTGGKLAWHATGVTGYRYRNLPIPNRV